MLEGLERPDAESQSVRMPGCSLVLSEAKEANCYYGNCLLSGKGYKNLGFGHIPVLALHVLLKKLVGIRTPYLASSLQQKSGEPLTPATSAGSRM